MAVSLSVNWHDRTLLVLRGLTRLFSLLFSSETQLQKGRHGKG
jgi:hypothetical protein